MVEHFKIEEAAVAREELSKRLAELGTAVAENAKESAKDAISDSIDAAEIRVKHTLDQLDPRAFIRQRPLSSLAGAFVTGLVVALARSPLRRVTSHPILSVATAIGADLIRAYALSHVNRVATPDFVPGRPNGTM